MTTRSEQAAERTGEKAPWRKCKACGFKFRCWPGYQRMGLDDLCDDCRYDHKTDLNEL